MEKGCSAFSSDTGNPMGTDEPAVLTVFHRADDPWSYLLLQTLPALRERYNVEFRFVTVPLPEADFAPRPEALMANGLRDAADVCRYLELDFPQRPMRPDPRDTALAQRLLLVQRDADSYLATALTVGHSLFSGDRFGLAQRLKTQALPDEAEAAGLLADGLRRQHRLGHYHSATIHFQNGWYWGIDRLHHLELVLVGLGFRTPTGVPGVLRQREQPLPLIVNLAPPDPDGDAVLRFYCSFRSPYAYVAAPRAFALADRYRLKVDARLIIPMKMAGFAIPRIKSEYFRMDCAREGFRHGVPFGRFTDPFGDGLRRAMAIFPYARQQGLEVAYILSVMRGVWADGLDTALDDDLARMSARAGLDAGVALSHADEGADLIWADRHREELTDFDQYAAPVFAIGDYMTWGQDRLWLLERVLDANVERRRCGK